MTQSFDDVTTAIAEYAVAFDATASDDAWSCLAEHVVDAFGCAVAAIQEEPARAASATAVAVAESESASASVIGRASKVAVEHAAFANAVMVRCLDFNDTYSGVTGGHPSDMIPGVLASAEAADVDGAAFLRGVFVAYEVFGALADQVPLRDLGWDQGVFIAIGCAAGIAACVGMDVDQAANAVSLATTTGVPLRVTRSGSLSAWKGCATPYAVMNAVYVTRLARAGLTGPPRPFRGVDGFLHRVGGSLDMSDLGEPRDGRAVVQRTGIKLRPVEWSAQAPVDLFVRLRDRFDANDVVSIEIEADDFLYREIGGGRGDVAEKWDPTTRETADHSMPYLVAVALMDGDVTLDSFRLDRVRDRGLRPLMRKIRVSQHGEDGLDRPQRPVRVEVRLNDGSVLEEVCGVTYGHPTRPATVEQVNAKFLELVTRVVDRDRAHGLLSALNRLSSAPGVAEVMDILRASCSRGRHR